jgi:hypothetical protein
MKQLFKSRKNDQERKGTFTKIKKLCEDVIKSNGKNDRIYKPSFVLANGMMGRLFCGNSAQGLPKIIRGLIMKHTTDIDMKNAHPKILLYLCKKYHIESPQLEYYCNHREAILSKAADPDSVKELYLKALNKNKVVKEIKEFSKEIISIQKEFLKNDEYKGILNTIDIEDKKDNLEGSYLNHILCIWENKILQKAIESIKSYHSEIEVAVLAFDGCMIYGNYYDDENLLNHITTEVNREFEGLNMNWSYKKHDETLQIPSDFNHQIEEKTEASENNTGLTEFVRNETEASETIYKLYPHWVFCKETLWVFDESCGIWRCDETSYFQVLKKYEHNIRCVDVINIKGKSIEVPSNSKGYGLNVNLKRLVIPEIKTLCRNDDWLKQTENSSLYKLLFNNGYLDLKTGLFHTEFNPDIVFFGKIHQDWTEFSEEDKEYMYDIRQRLFYNSLGNGVGDYLIINLARGLAGEVMKRMIFGLGNTNSGKGVLTTSLMLSCGDYIGSFNAENLSYNNSSADQSAQNRWIMLLRYKRIIISNEISNESKVKLNGNSIKKLASGGDTLVGRTHGKEETEFTPHFLPIVLANDLPDIKPFDDAVGTRARFLNYTKNFVDREPENEFELRGDPHIKEEIQTPNFQKCFVGLLLMTYMDWVDNGRIDLEPDEVKKSTEEWGGKDVDVVSKFTDEFEITNNIEDDWVRSSEIEDWLKDSKSGISMTKFSKELKKYLTIHSHDQVNNKYKKIAGKAIMCWFGIKRINEVEELIQG